MSIAILFLLLSMIMVTAIGMVTGIRLRERARSWIAPLICRAAGHRRSLQRVIKVGGMYHSRCTVCGCRMRKAGRGEKWLADAQLPSKTQERVIEPTI